MRKLRRAKELAIVSSLVIVLSAFVLFSLTQPAAGQSVASVERVDIVLADGIATGSQDLTLGQSEAKSVPFATFQHNATSNGNSDDYTSNMAEVEIYDNAGTAAVRITRTGTADPLYYTIYVVEFGSDITVQRGTVDIVGSTGTDVTITAVDQTKAFALFYYKREAGDADAHDSATVRTFFSSNTVLRLNRASTADGTFSGWWYVVEDTASIWNVQSGTISLTATDTSATNTISAVTMAKTFIVASMETTQADDDVISGTTRVDLQSTTLVRAVRNEASDTITVSHFAVEFGAGGGENVYRGLLDFSSTDTQLTASHTAVDPAASMAWSPIRQHRSSAGGSPGTGSSDNSASAVKVIINAGNNGVIADRDNFGANPTNFAWETVEWDISAAAIAFDASSQCTPGTGTTFTWSHTSGGTDRLLVVGMAIRNDASQTVASADYANVPLTFLRADTNGQSVRSELWYLVNPTSGINTVRVNLSASAKAACGAISLTGVHQSSPLDASNGATGSSMTPSVTVTTVADNAWVIDAVAFRSTGNGLPTGTPGSGQTERWSGYTEGGGDAPNVRGKGSTEGPQTPPGGVVMDWSLSASVDWATSAASFLPAGTLTCTGLTVSTSDPAGQLWFNETVEPDGLPFTTQVNVSASFQGAVTPALSVTNDGPGNCDITIRTMSDPGTGRSMKFNTTNSAPWPSDASKEVPLHPSSVTVCTSVGPGGTCDIWLWADFEGALAGQVVLDIRVGSQ